VTVNASVRSVDLRIAIGEAVGFDFRERVEQSHSNSLAAIKFTRAQLDAIAAALDVDGTGFDKHGLMDAIRERCGCEPTGKGQFHWAELKAIVQALGIGVDAETYYEVSADGGRESGGAAQSESRGVWAGWSGGGQA